MYLSRGAAGERAAREARARSASEELTREGTRVEFLGSTHVPEDEICFFTFDAPSRRMAALTAARAGIDALRVVEALSSGTHDVKSPRTPPRRRAIATVVRPVREAVSRSAERSLRPRRRETR